MKKLLLVIVISYAFSSLPAQNVVPYSQRMANSQMSRSGTLTKWDYPNGLFAESILKVFSLYPEDKYRKYVVDFADVTINSSTGQIYRYSSTDYVLDNINPGMFLLELQQILPTTQYKVALDTLRQQLKNQPRTNNSPDGGFWHKKIYPHQMWLDGLYMGDRFYAEYEKQYNDEAAYDDVVNQFTLIHSKTYDPAYQLNYHAWSATPDDANSFWANQSEPFLGCSKEFWGRGLGWYAAALVDVIEILPVTYNRRTKLVEIFQQVATGIKRWQDSESGCWFQLLRYDGSFKSAMGNSNYLEASSSSMFTYALLKALRLGIIEASEYKPVAVKAYNGLLTNFISEDASGNLSLNRICRSAGLGPASNPQRDGSASYYLDGSDAGNIVSNDLKGVGPFILASVEYEMMQKNETGMLQKKTRETKIKVFSTEGIVTVESLSQPISEVRCFDGFGKLVEMKKGNSENRFQFAFNAPNGIYFVRINNRFSAKMYVN